MNNSGTISDGGGGAAGDKVVDWDVLDFYGKYHLPQHAESRNRVRAKYPIHGNAIKRDQIIQEARDAETNKREAKLQVLREDYEHRVERKKTAKRSVGREFVSTCN